MKKARGEDDSSSLASTSSGSSSLNIAAVVSYFLSESSARTIIKKMTDIFVDNFCCCIIERVDEDPFIFKENNSSYLALCHLVHVKTLAVVLVCLKTVLFLLLIILAFLFESESLVIFTFILSFGLAVTSYVLLYTGLKIKKFHYLLPFFFITFIFIMTAVVYFFVDFLDSANTRDTMKTSQLTSFIIQISGISLEVYSLLVGWKLFNYICDWAMCEELKKKGVYIDEPLLKTDEPISISCASQHEINAIAASDAALNQMETIWNSKKKFTAAFVV